MTEDQMQEQILLHEATDIQEEVIRLRLQKQPHGGRPESQSIVRQRVQVLGARIAAVVQEASTLLDSSRILAMLSWDFLMQNLQRHLQPFPSRRLLQSQAP